MRRAVPALVLAVALAVPSGAAAQGGTTAPDLSEPCPIDYPGDGAQKRRIARWMARGAGDRGLPGELPVMAGVGESGLRNLSGGSFAGFFGMHLSIGQGEYMDDARSLVGQVCPPPVISDSQAPALAIRIARRQRPLRRGGMLTGRVGCPVEACLAGLTGSVTVGGERRSFRAAPAEPPDGGAATLQARLPRAARRALAKGRARR